MVAMLSSKNKFWSTYKPRGFDSFSVLSVDQSSFKDQLQNLCLTSQFHGLNVLSSFHSKIACETLLLVMQASAPLAIAKNASGQRDGGSSPAVRSPGLQWLHYLGVAEAKPGQSESQLSNLPSATAWLSRKSRQFLGFPVKDSSTRSPPAQNPPAQDQLAADRGAELLHGEEDVQGKEVAFSAGRQDGTDRLTSQAGPSPTEGPATSSPQEAFEALREDDQEDGGVLEQSKDLQAPQTVFSQAQQQGVAPTGKKPPERRRLHFQTHRSADRNAHRSSQRRGSSVPHLQRPNRSFSLPSSVNDLASSSNEDRGMARKASSNARAELQDHGSVSLAYSERDHSSDTEVTDGSNEPGLAKSRIPATSTGLQEAGNCYNSSQQMMPAETADPKQQGASVGADTAERLQSVDQSREQAELDQYRGVLGPVFVPIVMEMAEEDQAMLMQQRLSQQMVAFQHCKFGKASQQRVAKVFARQRASLVDELSLRTQLSEIGCMTVCLSLFWCTLANEWHHLPCRMLTASGRCTRACRDCKPTWLATLSVACQFLAPAWRT